MIKLNKLNIYILYNYSLIHEFILILTIKLRRPVKIVETLQAGFQVFAKYFQK